jgi:hypothetical protein
MKKSSSIKLVLIGAALASCNRIIIPSQSAAEDVNDSNLVAPPAISGNSYNNLFNVCCNVILPLWTYSFNPNLYPLNISQTAYNTARWYRRGHFWRNSHFIIRGGWGKNGETANS